METEKKVHIRTIESGKLHENNFHCYYESIVSFTEWKNIQYLGLEFKCRFCGETDRKQFKKGNAHTFPLSSGNKWLFSKDECKKCNSIFGDYENELGSHSLLMRSMYGIRKRDGYPKYKNNLVSFKNDTSKVEIKINADKKENINKEIDGETTIELDFINNEQIINLTLPEKEYIPLYLFKALAKIAFSIMPNEEFENNQFKIFTEWLRDKDSAFTDENYQPYFYIYHNRLTLIKREPLLMLFKKHSKYATNNMPSFSFLFAYGNHIFQIFLPYYSNDERLLTENDIDLLIIPELLTKNGNKGNFIWLNGFSKEKTKYKDFKFSIRSPIS